MDVVTRISETPVDPDGRALERVTVRSVTVRDKPPPEPIPFSTETDAELAGYRARLETDAGAIEMDFYPDRAPNHVRNFLRLADGGIFDGMAFHRIVRGFVIQTGYLPSRPEPPRAAPSRPEPPRAAPSRPEPPRAAPSRPEPPRAAHRTSRTSHPRAPARIQ